MSTTPSGNLYDSASLQLNTSRDCESVKYRVQRLRVSISSEEIPSRRDSQSGTTRVLTPVLRSFDKSDQLYSTAVPSTGSLRYSTGLVRSQYSTAVPYGPGS